MAFEGLFEIQSAHAGRFLSPKAGGVVQGTPVVLFGSSAGHPWNLWRIYCFSSGDVTWWEIMNMHSGRILNVWGGHMTAGTKAQLWDDNLCGNVHSQFFIHAVPHSDGLLVEIQSAHNGRCLSVFGGHVEDDTPVVYWDDEVHVNPHNVWRLVPASGPAVDPVPGLIRLQSVASGRCLSLKDGGMGLGTRVVVWEDDPAAGNPHSRWRLYSIERTVGAGPDAVTEQWVELQSVHSGRFLNVYGGGHDAGTKVHMWDDEVGVNPHNRWRLVSVPGQEGRVQLRSLHNKRFVKVFGGSTDQGAPVHLWEAVAGAGDTSGQWRVVPAEAVGDETDGAGAGAGTSTGTAAAPIPAVDSPPAVGAGSGTTRGTAPASEPGADGHKECIVCRAAPACVALVHGDSCHVCVCVPCTAVTGGLLAKCPICMQPVSSMLRVFT